MELMEAIRGRRSIRKYRPDPVSDDALNTVLEAARWAPSWSNTQCWRFIVVRDPATKAKLADALKFLAEGRENPAAPAVRSAPVVIVACAELGRSGYHKGEMATDKGDWFMFDVALAMHNLTLAAHAQGLGTVHVGLLEAKKVASILGVPQGIEVVEVLPLGYPDQAPAETPRKALAEMVFKERYGSQWP